MVRFFLAVFFLGTFLFSFSTAEAHVLKQDGKVQTILHIEPGDDPFVGREAVLYTSVRSDDKDFSPHTCDCHLKISLEGKVLLEKALFTSHATDTFATNYFTFPERNIYQIEISGKSGDSSSMFRTNYDFRVDRIPPENPFIHWLKASGIYGILFIMGVFLLLFIRKNKK